MTTALVTGATGHIGSNLVRELLERGYDVHVLIRVSSSLDGIRGLDVRVHHGDILEPASLDAPMQGVDVLFHCAAVYANWAPEPNAILRPAIEGTENVLRAASRAGVKRVVMTSSSNAVGFSTSGSPRNETMWNHELHLDYVTAKVRQERRAWELAEDLELELITVLPTGVIGPHDHRITPTTAYVRDVMAGKGPLLPGMNNPVHVRDVAIGHVLAAERGRPGERYLLGSENCTADQMAGMVERITGRRPAILGLPRFALMAVAWASEQVARLRGSEPALTTAMVRTAFGRHISFDVSKARDELGYSPRSPEEALQDTHHWLQTIGQVAPRPEAVHA